MEITELLEATEKINKILKKNPRIFQLVEFFEKQENVKSVYPMELDHLLHFEDVRKLLHTSHENTLKIVNSGAIPFVMLPNTNTKFFRASDVNNFISNLGANS